MKKGEKGERKRKERNPFLKASKGKIARSCAGVCGAIAISKILMMPTGYRRYRRTLDGVHAIKM